VVGWEGSHRVVDNTLKIIIERLEYGSSINNLRDTSEYSCGLCYKLGKAFSSSSYRARSALKLWKRDSRHIAEKSQLSLLIRGAKYSWGAEILLDNVSIGCVDDLEMRKTFQKIERPITNGIQMTTRSYVTVSDAHIALAKVWIDRCDKTHASCSMVSTTQAERPSRLLYVGVEPSFDDMPQGRRARDFNPKISHP